GAAAAALAALGVGVCVTVPETAPTGGPAGGDVPLVRDYPLSRLYRALDLVLSASARHPSHELLRPRVSSLVVPNPAPALDDQDGRGRYAADHGWAHTLPALSVGEAQPLLADLLADGAAMAARAQAADPGNGAPEAARLLLDLATGETR